MSKLTRSFRLLSLCVAGLISLMAGLLMAEKIIQPGIINDFGTSALVGLILLFVLPVLTALALRHDRKIAISLVGDVGPDRSNTTAVLRAADELIEFSEDIERNVASDRSNDLLEEAISDDDIAAKAQSEEMRSTEAQSEEIRQERLIDDVDLAIRSVRHDAHPRPAIATGRPTDVSTINALVSEVAERRTSA